MGRIIYHCFFSFPFGYRLLCSFFHFILFLECCPLWRKLYSSDVFVEGKVQLLYICRILSCSCPLFLWLEYTQYVAFHIGNTSICLGSERRVFFSVVSGILLHCLWPFFQRDSISLSSYLQGIRCNTHWYYFSHHTLPDTWIFNSCHA